MKRVLGVCVLAVLFAAMPARGQPGARTVPLEISNAWVQGESIIVLQSVTVFVPEVRREKQKVDGKEVIVEVAVQVPRREMRHLQVSLKDAHAFSGDGKALTADALAARFKQKGPILLIYEKWDGEAPFRGILKDDAVVLLLPAPPTWPVQPPDRPPQPKEKLPEPGDK